MNEFNWKEAIIEYKNSGLSLKQWCHDNDISLNKMRYQLYHIYPDLKKSEASSISQMIKVIPVSNCIPDSSITLEVGKA